MAEVSPDTIALWISRDVANENFRPLLDVSVEVLSSHLRQKSLEECAELAEMGIPRVVPALERIQGDSREDGAEPSFELSLDENTYYIKASPSEASRYVDRLLGLTPGDFERFCSRVLLAMGARSKVTGQPGDGGIDFVAWDLPLCSPAPKGARIMVIGQAKRQARDNPITEHSLRAYVGSSLHKTSDPDDAHCFRRNILAPVAFAFWTTSDFQPSARKFARALGLWYLNGTALAQLAIRLHVDP